MNRKGHRGRGSGDEKFCLLTLVVVTWLPTLAKTCRMIHEREFNLRIWKLYLIFKKWKKKTQVVAGTPLEREYSQQPEDFTPDPSTIHGEGKGFKQCWSQAYSGLRVLTSSLSGGTTSVRPRARLNQLSSWYRPAEVTCPGCNSGKTRSILVYPAISSPFVE